MQQEEQRAIADARQAGTEAAVEALLLEFLADFGFDLLPFHAEGRIGKHVVEDLAEQAVGGEGVAEDDVGDVLALDQHVGLADGVGLGVQFLAIHDQPGIGVQAGQVLARPRSTCRRCRRWGRRWSAPRRAWSALRRPR